MGKVKKEITQEQQVEVAQMLIWKFYKKAKRNGDRKVLPSVELLNELKVAGWLDTVTMPNGNTMLTYCIEKGGFKEAQVLLEMGANPNALRSKKNQMGMAQSQRSLDIIIEWYQGYAGYMQLNENKSEIMNLVYKMLSRGAKSKWLDIHINYPGVKKFKEDAAKWYAEKEKEELLGHVIVQLDAPVEAPKLATFRL